MLVRAVVPRHREVQVVPEAAPEVEVTALDAVAAEVIHEAEAEVAAKKRILITIFRMTALSSNPSTQVGR